MTDPAGEGVQRLREALGGRVSLPGSAASPAYAEVETIRKAVATLNPEAPSIATQNQNDSTLELIPWPEGPPDLVPERAKMLKGHEIFVSGARARCA